MVIARQFGSQADMKRLRRKMAVWEWENLNYFFNPKTFVVSDPGPLQDPIKSFDIKRKRDGRLILKTVSPGRSNDRSQVVPGTVRAAVESVCFKAHPQFRLPYNAVAQSVIHLRYVTNASAETHELETIETSSIRSIEGTFQESGLVALTIEWIENINSSGVIWTGASIMKRETTSTQHTIGKGEGAIDLLATKTSCGVSNRGLRLVIDGTELYLCAIASSKKSDKREDRGFIAYRGNVEDDKRRKIRHVLSFCLGMRLTSIGLVTLDAASEAICVKAFSSDMLGRARVPTLPPSPLWVTYSGEIHQDIVCKMANAIFARYDDLRFEELIWAYWHAASAPMHMAAAHYGAALEALRRACAESRSLRTTLLPDHQWRPLKERLLESLSDVKVDECTLEILQNKLSGINQLPQDKVMDEVLASMGLAVGTLERKAWQRRNKAAHGATFDRQQFTATIRETKILRILLHRMVLAETGASDRYYDYYSLGFPIRNLNEPIPPEADLPSAK